MKTRTIALLAATGLALAACHNKADEQPAAETNVTNLVEDTGNFANVATEAPQATVTENTTTAVAPPSATLTADEQTQDDADATGMTSRVDRSQADNTAQPVR